MKKKRVWSVLLAVAVAVTSLPAPHLQAAPAEVSREDAQSGDTSVLNLKFEKNGDTVDLTDSSSKHAEVTAAGTVTSVEGAVGTAISLDGKTGTFLNLGNDTALSPGKLTVSFWMKPNAAIRGEQPIAWNKNAWNSDGWYICANTEVPLELSVGPDTKAQNPQPYKIRVKSTDPNAFFPTNEWTHVTVTYDSDTKEAKIYRNGIPQETQISEAITGTAAGVIGPFDGQKSIGYNGPEHNSTFLNAALDEYRIYDKVLGVSDIVSFYKESEGRTLDAVAVEALEKADLAALAIDTETASSLTLPTEGAFGSVITWSSSEPTILTNTGELLDYPQTDTVVTLTASVSYAGETPQTQEFPVTVKALQEGQDPNLVLDLNFDEGNPNDASVYGNTVTVNGAAVSYPDGVNGKGIALNGTDNWLNLGTKGKLSPSKLSLSFWINPKETMTGERTITWNKDKWYHDGWYLMSESDTTPLALSVGPDTQGEGPGKNPQPYKISVSGTRSEFFPVGEWTHIFVTYDSDTKKAAVYRNGVLQKTNTAQGITAAATGVIGPCEGGQKAIGYNGPTHKSAFLNASLDEYRLYNKVFGVEDAIRIYEETGNKTFDYQAVAQSELDALAPSWADGTIFQDIELPAAGENGSAITWTSSNPEFLTNDGKVIKRPEIGAADQKVTMTASAKYLNKGEAATRSFQVSIQAKEANEDPSKVLELNFEGNLNDSSMYKNNVQENGTVSYKLGVNDTGKAVALDGQTWLDLGTKGALSPSKLSLSFWINPQAALTGEQAITWNKKEFNSEGWYLMSENDTTPLSLSVGSNTLGGNGQPYMISTNGDRSEFFPVGKWTHILVTYDSDTKEAAIYRNGIPQKTVVKYALSDTASGVITPCDGDLKVVGSNGPVYKHGAKLKALLDSYRLYNKVLGLEEVIEVYKESGLPFDKKAVAQRDIDALTVPESVTGKTIDLPVKGVSGSEISWKSSDDAVILPEEGKGIVTRPEEGEEAKTVTLTAAAVFAGGEAVTKTFTVTVKPKGSKNTDGILDCGIENVTLADSYLMNAAQKENEYLLSLNSKKFLYEFYKTAGLTPPTTEGYQGWERSNGTNFRGHTFGHYMSALSQAYRGTGDAAVKAKLLEQIKDAVEGLKACQDAYGEKHPDSAGYVSAFREDILNKVDGTGNSNENVIVPWYNLHKVLAGLIDIYTFVDDEVLADNALAIAENFSEYVYRRCSKLSDKTVMLRTEYGGMNEALYEIYDITGNDHYKMAAECFDETALFRELAAGNDVLSGKHANTTIPKLTGALKRYTVLKENEDYYAALTQEEKDSLESYKTAAVNFWDIVINHHTYVTGGNSMLEHFHDADKLYEDAATNDYNGSATCETCNTYNMLKLSRELYKLTRDKKYMDYYENTYINAILSSQNPETGTTMYFQPMSPGYNKVFNRPFDEFWCCTGTGMENFSKLGDTMYFTEQSDVYVNMYFSNTYTFAKQNLKLTQNADIPNQDEVTVTVAAMEGTSVAEGTNLKFRLPDWTAGEPKIVVNGTEKEITAAEKESGYAAVSNVKAGDTIKLTFPMEVRAYATQDNKDFVAFRYGPAALSAALGTNNIEASNPNGILVRVGTRDTTCKSVVTVQTKTVKEWMDHLKENLVRIEDSKDGTVQFQLKNTDSPELIYTPHFMRYKERYGLYMTFEVAGSEASQKRILERKQQLRQEEMAIDTLSNFDENNSEFAKNLASSKSSTGNYNGRLYRDAQKDGWFSYDMQINPQAEKNYLLCTWYSGDKGRNFDLYINDEKLQTITITEEAGKNVFYTQTIELPSKYWSEPNYKKNAAGEFVLDSQGNKIPVINAKFQGNGSGFVGGLYGITTTDTIEYSRDANLSALSFDKGELSPAFSGGTKDYTLTVPADTGSVSMNVSPNTPSGLIRIGEVLIDDSVPQLITLTEETTTVNLTATAQDHETTAAYKITIKKSSEAVEPKPADRTALNTLIQNAQKAMQNANEADYELSIWKALEDALREAKALPENADQAAVDAMAEALQKAYTNFAPKDIKAALSKLLTEAKDVMKDQNEADYEAGVWKALKDAISAAEQLDPNASDSDVTAIYTKLREAMDNFKKMIPVTSITIEPASHTMIVGESLELKVTIQPADATNKTITYTSSPEGIVTISKEGLVTAKKEGKTKVTAAAIGGAKAECAITVEKEKEPIVYDKETLKPVIERAKTLIQSGEAYEYEKDVWKELEEAIAEAEKVLNDQNAAEAQIKAVYDRLKAAKLAFRPKEINKTTLGTLNTEAVNAMAGKNKADYEEAVWNALEAAMKAVESLPENATETQIREVYKNLWNALENFKPKGQQTEVPVTAVTLNKTEMVLSAGGTENLTATIAPANATNKTVTWETNNAGVATVVNGKVTAVKAGTAVITAVSAADKTKKAFCTVTVKAASSAVRVQSVKVNVKKLTLGVKEKYTLKATVKPSNVKNKKVAWKSNKTKIVSVKNGKLTAKKTGKAKITVTSQADKKKKATVTVTVKKAPVKKTKVTLNKKKVTLKTKGKKKTFQIKARVKGNFGCASFKYTIDKKGKKAVKVDKNGKVTAKKKGKASITVKTYNGKAKAVLKVTVK